MMALAMQFLHDLRDGRADSRKVLQTILCDEPFERTSGSASSGPSFEVPCATDFVQLVEERVELARIERIGELSDQISSPDKPGFGLCLTMTIVGGNREAESRREWATGEWTCHRSS
jgi:hypothetical protein